MSKHWDHCMKMWAKANPQDFVSWLLKDGIFLSEANVEIKTDSRFADLMFAVQWKGQNMILHVDFQREHDPTMNKRVWLYNTSTCIHPSSPISAPAEKPFEKKSCGGEMKNRSFLTHTAIRNAAFSPEAFRQETPAVVC